MCYEATLRSVWTDAAARGSTEIRETSRAGRKAAGGSLGLSGADVRAIKSS